MSPGQTGHITGQKGRVPGTDGTHTRGCPAKILCVYWFIIYFPNDESTTLTKVVMNIASSIWGVVYIFAVLVGSDNSCATPSQYHFSRGKSFVGLVCGWQSLNVVMCHVSCNEN